MRNECVILAWALVLAASMAGAQVVSPPGPFEGFKSAGKEPVEIHSDRMGADLASGRLEFEGHVVAKQGERVIYADHMDVKYTRDGKVTSLTATGNVKVTMKEAFVAAGRLHLDNLNQVILLTEEPRLVQQKQMITGDKMTYKIAQEKLVVQKPRIEWVPEIESGKEKSGSDEKTAQEPQEQE